MGRPHGIDQAQAHSGRPGNIQPQKLFLTDRLDRACSQANPAHDQADECGGRHRQRTRRCCGVRKPDVTKDFAEDGEPAVVLAGRQELL